MKRFELLIFDWDGTLVDSTDAIVESLQAAAADLGWRAPSREAARHIIGLGLKEAVTTLFPERKEAEIPRLVERYRHHYLRRDHEITLFSGARELIEELHGRGYRLAVATGKARGGLDRAFTHTGLGRYFHASRTADETRSKPHPTMLWELLDTLATPPERALMIGDTSHDLAMAANAGIAAVAAGYGAHPIEHLRAFPALAFCDDFPALAQWLRENA